MIKFLIQTIKDLIKRDDSVLEMHERLDKISYDMVQLSSALSALAHIVNKHNNIINDAVVVTSEVEKKSINLEFPDIHSDKCRKPN